MADSLTALRSGGTDLQAHCPAAAIRSRQPGDPGGEEAAGTERNDHRAVDGDLGQGVPGVPGSRTRHLWADASREHDAAATPGVLRRYEEVESKCRDTLSV